MSNHHPTISTGVPVGPARDLEGKAVLVTGASSGIGKAIALHLGSAGGSIAVNYHAHPEAAQAVVDEITASGARAVAVQADISNANDVTAMVNEVVEQLGALDVLVNNAGMEMRQPLLEVTAEEWDHVLAVNLRGAFLCLQAAARVMAERGGGSIVNISSVHEELAFPGFAPYAASKGGLMMLMRTAALELAEHGIRVNNIAPGAIATPINQDEWADPAKLQALESIIPLRRVGKPEEVADAVLFLASDRASYVTASTYFVDGGLTRFAQGL
jgi:glucose 1-dehydrogenase